LFKYFETTALILLWSFFFSLIWTLIVYSWTSRAIVKSKGFFQIAQEKRIFQGQGHSWKSLSIISPALLVAPLVLIFSHDLLGLNLLFPVHLTADFYQLLLAAMAPALVLLLACGLLGQITRQIPASYAEWSRKTFVTMTKSYGGTPRRALRRIVVGEVLSRAWSQSLPWFFGELIVVECVFNAPGLGLDAWHEARVRHWVGLFEALLWLASLYGAAVVVSALFTKWLGKRLESYS
jgi:ABC-type dipeptide/oligopeptide/nickel transport system permease component